MVGTPLGRGGKLIKKLILALTMAAMMTFAPAGPAFAQANLATLNLSDALTQSNTAFAGGNYNIVQGWPHKINVDNQPIQINIANQQAAADQLPRITRIAADFALR